MSLKKMKLGTAFQLSKGGAVYVRCDGGFRLGLGGELFPCLDLRGIVYIS
jgi:hypothetical protein